LRAGLGDWDSGRGPRGEPPVCLAVPGQILSVEARRQPVARVRWRMVLRRC
jgi:hypothetical protein